MLDMTRHYLLDGGMGTMLQERGLQAGGKPELLNLSAPEVVRDVHAAYVEAGSDIITTNTFGASRHKLGCDPAPYIQAAVRLAREAGAPLVALDLGPTGAMLQPMGEMPFELAYDLFAEQVEAGVRAGADLILVETMSDLLECKAAVLAAREHSDLPVFATMTFGADGRTFLGTEPRTAAVALTALGVDAVGINCSLGPRELLPMVREMIRCTHLPVIVQPNAGIPRLVDGQTVFQVGPEEFADCMADFQAEGAAILGGCCGTTPRHIAAVKARMAGHTPVQRRRDGVCRLTGWQRVVEMRADSIATVGERVNPTGRQRLKEALYRKDYAYAAELAIEQEQEGADFLVVNAGLPDIDEVEALPQLVQALQRVSPLPLVIDSANPKALEKALRIYSGRPILNSVNGTAESLAAVLPLAKKYGTALIALTLDEKGISPDPAARCALAERIVAAGEAAGIPKEDFFIDTLTLAASVSGAEVMAAAEAIRLCRSRGLKTVLGVSNVSHGLPNRGALNCAFLSAALLAGLNLAIVNTGCPAVLETIAAVRVLSGADRGCADYIAAYAGAPRTAGGEDTQAGLEDLILRGIRSEVPAVTEALLEQESPLDVVNRRIVPTLETVGMRYERGELFLPQLMASAEAVKAAFEVLNRRLPQGTESKGTILLATVKGDVHDIGKNIVKMLLENYGYRIVDLGRDVEPKAVVEAALRERAPLIGLSSLMTTTAQNIAVTIRALRSAGVTARVMVGGAVVTQEFADQIGADFYAKDANQSARYAAQVFAR